MTYKDYRPIPFWSWNDKLEEKELIEQIRWMKDAGFGGGKLLEQESNRDRYLTYFIGDYDENALRNCLVYNTTIEACCLQGDFAVYSEDEYVVDVESALREQIGMNRKEFCDYFQVPYQLLIEWEQDDERVPKYVLRMLEYYVRMNEKG